MTSMLYIFSRQRRDDCRLIPEPGANFEHRVIGLDIEQVGHQRDDKRLRDRLLEADRKRRIGVGMRLKLDGHKGVTRHLIHDLHYPPGKGRFADPRAHIDGLDGDLRDHGSAQGREIVWVHGDIPDSKRERHKFV